MRVAWDLQAVTGPKPTGLGVSVRLLMDAFNRYSPDGSFIGLPPNDRDEALASVPDRVRWEQSLLPWRVRKLQKHYAAAGEPPLDLLYCPALGAPVRCVVPVMSHVHDLIALRNPEQFSGWARMYWKRLLPHAWRRTRAITVSNAWLRKEVATRLPYADSRIHIVPYYADPQLVVQADRLAPGWREQRLAGTVPLASGLDASPLFLCLGSQEQRKNFGLAIIALGELRLKGLTARLRIVGGQTEYSHTLEALIDKAKVRDQVELLDYQPREELTRSLLEATALLFVSTYEGYGMPPQEAQSLGCPVVLSDIGCHRAVYDDHQRWEQVATERRSLPPFVETGDSSGLAGQMQRLMEDVGWRAELAAAGMEYQRTFSAEQTALALMKAFGLALSTNTGA